MGEKNECSQGVLTEAQYLVAEKVRAKKKCSQRKSYTVLASLAHKPRRESTSSAYTLSFYSNGQTAMILLAGASTAVSQQPTGQPECLAT